MAKLTVKQLALYQELEKFLLIIDKDMMCKNNGKEIVYSKIMPTKRLFRADFYCPSIKVLVEVNGGQWTNGRHTRGGVGYENDLTKLNIAQLNGFKVYQFTYEMLARREYDIYFLHLKTKNDKLSDVF